MSKARRDAAHHLALQPLAHGGLLHRDQRPLDVGKAVDDGLAVELQQFVLPALLQIELALQADAVEDRLRQAGREIEERRFRPQQRLAAPRSGSRPRRSAEMLGKNAARAE